MIPLWLGLIVLAVFVILVVQDAVTYRACAAGGHQWRWNDDGGAEQCTVCGRWNL